MTLRVDFGSRLKNRVSVNFEGWMSNLRQNFEDVVTHPGTLFTGKSDINVGIALGSGPSARKLIAKLEKAQSFVVSAADRSATAFTEETKPFWLYVASTDCSPQIAEFYRKMPMPLAAFIPIFTHPTTAKVLKDRGFNRFYYTPAFQTDDRELLLLNKAMLDLTGCPLIEGVADSGAMAFRILLGLGLKRIALLGLDYAEPADSKPEDWTLWLAYKQYMDYHKISLKEMFKRLNVRKERNKEYGNEFWSDNQWDHYRARLYHIIRLAEKQEHVKTYNVTEGGSLDELPCTTLERFLERKN